jgi:DNA-binding transcriptional ArsR family regulator
MRAAKVLEADKRIQQIAGVKLERQTVGSRRVSVHVQRCVLFGLAMGPNRDAKELALVSQLSVRTVRVALAALRAAGLVEKVAA